jgi:hypothetical protein
MIGTRGASGGSLRMPRYYFHIADGQPLRDEEGIELANLHDAEIESTKCLGEFLLDRPSDLINERSLSLTVTDERGLILTRLDVMSTRAAASGPDKSRYKGPAH